MARYEEFAIEILQEFTNCYSEQDEELLTDMIEQEIEIAKQEVAKQIFEEIKYILDHIGYLDHIDFADLKKKYIGENNG